MIGMQTTHIRQNGRRLLNMAIVILVFALLFSGCSADWWIGDGRGDWTLDLCAGYSIARINSCEKLFVHNANPDAPGSSIIISNYFVTAYQVQEPFILLEGIPTPKITISDDELRNRVLKYYLVDTTDGEVSGPFDSLDDYVEYCGSKGVEMKDNWIIVKE